jgi:Ca2+-binding EF-hand superfamily protein
MRSGQSLLAFCLVLGAGSLAEAQTSKSAGPPMPLRDLFLDLDANADRVIERSEVPAAGKSAFDTLLKYGDRNHDGKLEAEEYRDLLQKVSWNRIVSPEQREQRFKSWDKNQDGKIGRDEFPNGPARFAQLDRNGDGFLSRDEIPWLNPGGAVQPGPQGPPEGPQRRGQLLQRLKQLDSDGDGRVSRDEFTGRPAMFDRLDTNHDGYLDSADQPRVPAAEAAKKGKARP